MQNNVNNYSSQPTNLWNWSSTQSNHMQRRDQQSNLPTTTWKDIGEEKFNGYPRQNNDTEVNLLTDYFDRNCRMESNPEI